MPTARAPTRRCSPAGRRRQATAIFAANNLLAEHAWHGLRERGLVLPRDISLVAFDDVPWMTMVMPGITAVTQPTVEMGRRAARLLLRRLIVRGSTSTPPKPS